MTLREDEIERRDGSRGIYSVVEKPDFALIVPEESDGFWLVEQFRYPVGARSWEFPQGTFPQGKTGTAEALATAELAEETGIAAGQLEKIGFLYCAKGMSSQGFHIFVATELQHGTPNRETEEQDMIHKWFSRADVETMIKAGEITDDSTIAAYALVMLSN
ncbi:NUDIX domain-containing protein [Glycomyces buryatensis]|uniref:NUDIX hydrolase n=1 Tax=Glycomyces buryatensis TaxID=2570927 RepID=A0A4S8Q915_9ACTN|nr:NUDIX hydrolase [Glycomyces buryatensis]